MLNVAKIESAKENNSTTTKEYKQRLSTITPSPLLMKVVNDAICKPQLDLSLHILVFLVYVNYTTFLPSH